MGSKLFVGSLSWNTTDDSLKAAFEAHGPVREARVIMDRDTGRSRGFGFVTFEEEAHAKAAVDKIIADIGAGGLKDMGAVMGALRENYASQMDFGKASAIVKARLSG